MEICKSYFEMYGKVVDGFKVMNEFGKFRIYTYTSCEKLGNFQLFLEYKTLEQVKKYFKNLYKKILEENDQTIEWNKKEAEFIGDILNIL